jgi:hypothetical protein
MLRIGFQRGWHRMHQIVNFPQMCRAAAADAHAVEQWIKNKSIPGLKPKPSGRRGVPREFDFADLLRIALRVELIKGGISDRLAKQIGVSCIGWFDLILNGEVKKPPLMLILSFRGRTEFTRCQLAEGVELAEPGAPRESIGEVLDQIACDYPTSIIMINLYEIMWRVFDRANAEGLEFMNQYGELLAEHVPQVGKVRQPA